MSRKRIISLGVLALFIVGGIGVSAASAAGPYWHVGGSRFEKGTEQAKLQTKGILVQKAPSLGIDVTCNRVISEGGAIEGNLTSQGQDKGRLSTSSCKTKIANCSIAEPIITRPLKSYLALANTQTKIVDVLEPSGVQKEGETPIIDVFKLSGTGCGLLVGEHPVTGSMALEVIPVGIEVQEGLLVSPQEPIEKIKHEGVEKNIGLSLSGLAFSVSGTYGVRLAKGERFGVTEL